MAIAKWRIQYLAFLRRNFNDFLPLYFAIATKLEISQTCNKKCPLTSNSERTFESLTRGSEEFTPSKFLHQLEKHQNLHHVHRMAFLRMRLPAQAYRHLHQG